MSTASTSGSILRRHVVWVLLEAGLDPEELPDAHRLDDREPNSRGSFHFRLLEQEPPSTADVALSPGPSLKVVEMSVTSSSPELVRRFDVLLTAYSASADGEGYRDQSRIEAEAHHAWGTLDRALLAASLPPITEDRTARKLDDATARVLMSVFEANGAFRARERVLFALQAPRTSRPVKDLLANWLLEQFSRFENRRHRDAMTVALLDLVGPEQVGKLTALLRDETLGSSRAGLLVVLGKTKAPEAGAVLASHLGGRFTVQALQGLEQLGTRAAELVRPLLHDARAEVRRFASRTLRRMGFDMTPAVPRLHLVKGKANPPGHLSEWSTNLDIDNLPDALAVVGSVMSGFGPAEVAEVTQVVESMKVNQTRWFRFPVQFRGELTEAWVGIFLDDVDAPDLYVMAVPEASSELADAWSRSPLGSK